MFKFDDENPAPATLAAKDETALTPKAEATKPKRIRKSAVPKLLGEAMAEARSEAGDPMPEKPKRVRKPAAKKVKPEASTKLEYSHTSDGAGNIIPDKPKRVRKPAAKKSVKAAKPKRAAKATGKAKTKRVAKAKKPAKSKGKAKASRKTRIHPPFKFLPKGSTIKWASAAGCKGEKHNHRGVIIATVPRLTPLPERVSKKVLEALVTSNYGVSNRDRYIVEVKSGGYIAANAKAATLVDAK